ncbi:hypothetical protein [Lichenicoccus sp.]|uniref:hypothetical protein n=1 Tax=Lichenicoccus sp. TaxID=2781899 RepID=UPI003D10CDF5
MTIALMMVPAAAGAQSSITSQIDNVYAAQQRQDEAARAALVAQHQREQQVLLQQQRERRLQAQVAVTRARKHQAEDRAKRQEARAATLHERAYED